MDKAYLKKILEDVKEDRISVEEALIKLRDFPYKELGFAKIDTHRAIRKNFAEVILCEGKSVHEVTRIFKELGLTNKNVLATRATEEVYKEIQKLFPEAEYNEKAKTIALIRNKERRGNILVITGGTADIRIAEEAVVTAEVLGNRITKLYDVGISGLHRLLDNLDKIYNAKVIIVVAGMEGSLASVVCGLASSPVIAVPTSVGYGANFNGLASLLTMLNSCTPGMAVVNIDNGFGAAYIASLINQK